MMRKRPKEGYGFSGKVGPAGRIRPGGVVGTAILVAVLGCGTQIDVGTARPPPLCDPACPSGEACVQGACRSTRADVLFVIDESLSTDGEQARLAALLEQMAERIASVNKAREARGDAPVDWRAAVTTTSVPWSFGTTYGPLETSPTMCVNPRDVRRGDPYPDGAFVAAPGNPAVLEALREGAAMGRRLSENILVGTCGSGKEMGLLAMERALDENWFYVRRASRLVVVFLTDEEDCSDPDDLVDMITDRDACAEEAALPDGGALGPVRPYAALLFSLSAEPRVVAMVSAAHDETGRLVPGICRDALCEADCTSPDPTGHPCYCGGQSGGSRYFDLAAAVPGSVVESMCDGLEAAVEHLTRLLLEVALESDPEAA